MYLHDVDFGRVSCASGTLNFDGSGWPHHHYLEPLGLNPKFNANCSFTAKTTTLLPRLGTTEHPGGNMPLKPDGLTPIEIFPKCIVIDFRKGHVLNSVGLSGNGAEHYLKTGMWQAQTQPFRISFMSVEKELKERLREAREFTTLLAVYLPEFRAHIALQINFSCPNVGKVKRPSQEFIAEVWETLNIFSALGIPLEAKLSVTTSIKDAWELSNHPNCDSLCVSNTVPWGELPLEINWHKLFGTEISPLAAFGGGGLSGKPILPIVCRWIRHAKRHIKKPIHGGGGILSPRDAKHVIDAGADSIFIGAMTILRSWRVEKTILTANSYLADIGK